ncbi:hypothetical protein B0H66DRAFT_25329 [Apodospora peruviana]|uniref:E3 ubiquitin-protein ligase UBR1-like winged-helix domain-containing protein n=1 Tax=Apodospora peruviana TaxID=516989 RepID=A0AAE0MEC6_9PEZI|nr:hypothetical protein B0H66DRAFT_25329 [Apodospora peruviana]
MVINIPENGLLMESSPKVMAALPTQAFAISLSDSVIEDMIACVQNGQDVQLSLGSNPAFLFDDREVRIPKSKEPFEYDLFHSGLAAPTLVNKLPNPTMSIFRVPKYKKRGPKAPEVAKSNKAAKTAGNANSKLNAGSPSDQDLQDAIAELRRAKEKEQADKRENSTVIVDTILPTKGGKGKAAAKGRLLGAQSGATPRSLPPSPALSGLASPSLGPTSAAHDKLKQQRFPIIHELAAQESTFDELLAKYNEGTEQEFTDALNKVADFDSGIQKWSLRKMYWKELDVFQYDYSPEEHRQKAIDNAIKQYDRMRLGSSEPVWQKLLPMSERGKGICLSKLQAAIAKGPSAATPKINVQKAGTASPSGGDSEKDDSASSGAKKTKGGEPMSRSNSQTSTKKKLSASEAQAKRLLSNSKKPAAAAAAKASPKVSPTKPPAKASAPKGGRVLSKEFISDSDSDNDEVPLSVAKGKPAPAPKPVDRQAEKPKPAEKIRPAEKPKPTEKVKAIEKPRAAEKPKAAPAPMPKSAPKAAPRDREREPEQDRDTIRAQVIAKPTKPPAKRSRDIEEDDSSSSGTPLSKRIKPAPKAQLPVTSSIHKRAPSDASQYSRGTTSGVSLNKTKNTSPMKSSPLASSPPTNASDVEDEQPARPRARKREREHDRDTIASSSSSNSGISSTGSTDVSSIGVGRKRPAQDASSGRASKRQRMSREVVNEALKFKQYYMRYQELHEAISRLEEPDPAKVTDLMDMHHRLSEMKNEIYSKVAVEQALEI